jgi:prepilin-type N-terminal cleavage/methylation domain-containing protein
MPIQNKKAFTLVELIVVITILAILWTVAFLSFQWYSASVRDSTRITDIKTIEKVFSIYFLKESKYPTPTDWEEITYSWTEVWTQGTFWKATRMEIWTKWNISNIPKDPLTLVKYTYSLSNNKQEYQIAGVFEWDLSLDLNNINSTYAKSIYWSTYIKWNYNGKIIKVHSWWIDYVLAVPSIIKWTTTETDLLEIIKSKDLTSMGSNNIPLNYSWTLSDTNFDDKSIEWDIVNKDNLVVFSWSLDDLTDSPTKRIEFIENLQKAYSETLVSNTD